MGGVVPGFVVDYGCCFPSRFPGNIFVPIIIFAIYFFASR